MLCFIAKRAFNYKTRVVCVSYNQICQQGRIYSLISKQSRKFSETYVTLKIFANYTASGIIFLINPLIVSRKLRST